MNGVLNNEMQMKYKIANRQVVCSARKAVVVLLGHFLPIFAKICNQTKMRISENVFPSHFRNKSAKTRRFVNLKSKCNFAVQLHSFCHNCSITP
jgi:hypothetical protein